MTDRFTRALDQLGSDELDVRLGGIYALERLMEQSRDDRRTIIDVLVAYVRQHAPASLAAQTPAAAAQSAIKSGRRRPATDVQAAVTVLAHRTPSTPNDALDVSGIALVGVQLNGAHLAGANLNGADLGNADLGTADLGAADLIGADLSGAVLDFANLRDANVGYANLTDAHLDMANLTHADLTRANLGNADLRGVTLMNVNLTGADLSGADLRGADLRGADLRGADLRGADLRGARGVTGELVRCVDVDDQTALPAGVARPVPGAPEMRDRTCQERNTSPEPSPPLSR